MKFSDKALIAFVMSPDLTGGVGCNHVLVKLPDGSYYDGGNGVISAETLLSHYGPTSRIEDMERFDFELLD